METKRNYALTQSKNTASITNSTPAPTNINIIDDETTINITGNESYYCIKANHNEIILVTLNYLIKGKYKGETGTIIKVIMKKIALNLGGTKQFT